MKILIVVDNPVRDLSACTLLATELSRQHQVYLTSMSQSAYECFRLKPDLVILNYLRVINLPLVYRMIACGIRYSILDTEGGVFSKIPGSNDNSYHKTLVKDQFSRDHVEHYFAWGTVLAQDMKDRKVYPTEKIFCTGTPRTDFYHVSFRPFFVEKNEQNSRPMILINTSFPGNNPKFNTRENEKKNLIAKFHYPAEFVEKMYSGLDTVMNKYIELTRYLAEKMPDVDFVLRPHPFESHQFYINKLSNIKNVTVDGSDMVVKWILRSKALIHFQCSTAIEAGLSQIPSMSLSGYDHLREIQGLSEVTEYCDSFAEMEKVLQNILSGHHKIPDSVAVAIKTIENEIYCKVDGKSYQRIADIISATDPSSKSSRFNLKEEIRNHTAEAGASINDKQKSILTILKQRLLSNLYFSFYFLRSGFKWLAKRRLVPPAKRFSLNEVESILEKLKTVEKISHCQSHAVFLSSAIQISSKATDSN